jgi:Cytochrome P460
MCSQKERRMKSTHSMLLVVCCALAAFVTMTAVHAGIDRIAFPREYAKGVMYTSHDLADVKEYREFYITPAALEAVHKDQPLPSGTVITLARYSVRLDAQGNPVKDDNGRFIKTELKAFRVMEKRTGWGSEYPTSKRTGEWEYQAFLADGKVDGQVDLNVCFQCHKNGDSMNFMFTGEQLKSAVR